MWQLLLPPASFGDGNKAQQIARAIAADIARGRLRPGDPMPSTRALAEQLATQRKVITEAYADLARQGWLEIAPARGAWVSPELGRARAPRSGAAEHAGFTLPGPRTPEPSPIGRAPDVLLLLGGVPELRILPQLALGRAYRRVWASRDGARLADYGDSQGDLRLRSAISEMLRRTRGLAHDAERLAIVRGSQMAFYLAARTLVPAGGRIAIEELSYPMAWQAFRAAGASLVPIAIDKEGMNIDSLERAWQVEPFHAIYVSPHHHVPTTVTMSAARRQRLLAFAKAHRCPILEDDHDHEFQYDGAPVPPIASADRHGLVVYLGSLSKGLAPGLRIGYVAAPREVIARFVRYREAIDQQGDLILERALAHLFEEGEVERQVRKAKRLYRERRDVLAEALHKTLPELSFELPAGGMALWVRAPGREVAAWADRARQRGVAFQPGVRFSLVGSASDRARLGFASCTPSELVEAVRRMASAKPRR